MDDIAVREDRYRMLELDGDGFRMGIRMMSVGPAGEEWLNEHAPGWREHVSLLDMNVEHNITGLEAVMAVDPLRLIRECRVRLAHQLATAIVERLEPITSRYAHGREPIRMPRP